MLIEGEEVVRRGAFHWTYGLVTWLLGLLFMGVALGLWIGAGRVEALNRWWIPLLPLALGAGFCAGRVVYRLCTEMAVTSRRVVFKRGWIARRATEIPLERLEEVNVAQSVAQRLVGSGRVAVRGMGVGEIVLPVIADPVGFRREIERAKAAGET